MLQNHLMRGEKKFIFSSEIRTLLARVTAKKINLKASSVAGNSIIMDACQGGQSYLQGQSYPGLRYHFARYLIIIDRFII